MEASDPLTISLTGELPFILISAAAIAWPVSLGLLKLYRTHVIKTMKKFLSHGETSSRSIFLEISQPETIQERLHLSFLDATSPLSLGSDVQQIFQKSIQAPKRLALVYIGGGISYALVMTWCYLSATEIALLMKRFIPLFWLYVWPTALVMTLILTSIPEKKRLILAAYFGCFLILSGWAAYGNPDVSVLDLPMVWLVYNLGPTLFLLAFLTRRVRAVGPLVFIFLVMAMFGSHLVLSLVGQSDSSLLFATQIGQALGVNAIGIFIGLIILGFVIFGGMGWLLAKYIGRRYQKKVASDQSTIIDAIFLLFGVVHPISLVFEGIGWIMSGLLAFLSYKVCVRIGTAWLKNTSQELAPKPTLLLLRVFSLGKRSEDLFDAVGLHWRHIGPIQLIAGPDLATTTVEPHEFLDFLSGKLARRFINGSQTLQSRLEEMDVKPDHDGRYRINEFFCYENTWQMVLSKLIGHSDVVLMDLRSFSRQNAGCQYEVKELINLVPLTHVVFIVDSSTDESFLQEMIHQLWTHTPAASPNRQHHLARLTMFRLQSSMKIDLYQLLRIICQATEDAVRKMEGVKLKVSGNSL